MKKKGLTFKISVLFTTLVLLIGAALTFTSYCIYKQDYIENENSELQELVNMVASYADGDKVKAYYETGVKDDYYDELYRYIDNIAKNVDNMGFIYIMVPEKDHFTYIVDAEGKRYDNQGLHSELGEIYEYTETEYKYLVPDVENKRASQGVIFGRPYPVTNVVPISAWAPIFDSNGEFVAMVESDMELELLYKNMKQYLIITESVLLTGIILLLALVLYSVRKYVTYPINKLTKYISSYHEGEFRGDNFEYQSDDEIKWLYDSFVDMDGKIKDYTTKLTHITAEKERIGAELNVATKIQASMLPKIFPPFPDRKEFTIYASMDPAKEVGGDFYDFFMIDDIHLGMVIADVSGKGVPAALFMMMSKILIKNQAYVTLSPAEILTVVNNQLCENNDAEMFVTVWIGVMDITTGKIMAASAGHEYPTIKRADGQFELFKDKRGLVLAGMENIKYKEYELQLNPGDTIFVYTDGVAEATNNQNELFGTDRLIVSLNKQADAEGEQLLVNIRNDIDTFVGTAPQFDDITMLTLTYKGI